MEKRWTIWDIRSGKLGLHQFLEQALSEHTDKIQRGEQVIKVVGGLDESGETKLEVNPRPKLFFQLRGQNEVTHLGGVTVVEPGEMLIIRARAPHRERRIYQRKRYAHIYTNLSGHRFVYNAYVLCSDKRKRQNHIATAFTDNEKCDFAQRLLDELCQRATVGDYRSAHLTQTLAEALLRQLSIILASPQWEGVANPLVVKCKQLIQHQMHLPALSVASIAEQLHVHPDYLSRLFSEQENQRLVPYIVHCRMNLAKEILRNLSIRIEEAAMLCGYAERAYFTKVFKRSMGMTPSQYRARVRAAL